MDSTGDKNHNGETIKQQNGLKILQNYVINETTEKPISLSNQL